MIGVSRQTTNRLLKSLERDHNATIKYSSLTVQNTAALALTRGFSETRLTARIGGLPTLDDIFHPYGNAGFYAFMGQNVESVIFYGIDSRRSDI